MSQPPFSSTPPWQPAQPQRPVQPQPTEPPAQVPSQSDVPQQPSVTPAQAPLQQFGPQAPQGGPQQPTPYGSAPSPNPYPQPNPYAQQPNPYPYPQPNPHPQQPAAPSHLGANGALQSFGTVPGAPGQQRPGSGYYAPQRSQPVAPAGGSPHPAVAPKPPKSSKAGLIIGVSALLVVALVVAIVFAGGYAGKLLGAGSTPSASTSATSTATPSPTTTGIPGQVVSKPPVPAPTATTSRAYNSPDRPKSVIPTVKPVGFVNAPAGSGISRYTNQKLTWSECTIAKKTAQCATTTAPLDYASPNGQAITLSLVKVPATASPRLGTIFVNPGGPGEPGTTLAVAFQRTGLEQYDIVGWDPRGTGSSTPVVCANGAVVDQWMQLDQSPDTAAEKQALLDGWKAFGASCLAKSGALLQHISTQDTVQDLDLMRQLVGDAKLNYLGYSYGTYIGAVYAQKFTANVGKLVLDSAVNITQDESVVQASGFDLALGNYADYCASKKCSLGSSKQAVLDTITKLLDKLDTPISGDATRKLTQSLATDGIAIFLYSDSQYWDQLTEAIEKAIAGDGRYLLFYGDQLRGRETDGQYDPSFFAFPAIGCADSQDDGIARAYADWASDEKKAPIFGKFFGPYLTCVTWPVQGDAPLDITAKGAAPIVVVGATGDSATPYQYAAWMADQLDSAVLVTYNGNGHATYGSGRSTCVDTMVVSYFAQGTLPPDGLFCSS